MTGQPEELPFIQLNLAGEEFKATPLNAQLFTFAGRSVLENGMEVENEIYDHVFLDTHEPREEVRVGTYLFQPEIVGQMAVVMVENGFPCRLNQREVPDCDRDAKATYDEQNAKYEADQIGDFIPDGWGG